jgi:tRNA (adenine57-N1/adenine58-N1)-methyltransferase
LIQLDADIIREDDDVLFYLDSKRTYLIKVRQQESLHTHKGVIKFEDVIGQTYGNTIPSHSGTAFIMLKPSIYDYIKKMRHATQVIYPKDIALIVTYTNIGPGSRVIEAGTGSGVLTTALAYYIKPTGKVYSYEYRPNFLEIARKNIMRTSLEKYVELQERDVTQGFTEANVDAVILDLATPWLIVPFAAAAIKVGGRFLSFSPTIEQTVKTTNALNTQGFINIETVETILRRIKVKEGQTRPETLMIGHTGYITHARKIN